MRYPKIGFQGTQEINRNERLRDALRQVLFQCHVCNTYALDAVGDIYFINPEYQRTEIARVRPSNCEVLTITDFAKRLVEYFNELKSFRQSLKIGDCVTIEPIRYSSEYYPLGYPSYFGDLVGKPMYIKGILPDALSTSQKRKRFYSGDNNAYMLDGVSYIVDSSIFEMGIIIPPTIINLEDLNMNLF